MSADTKETVVAWGMILALVAGTLAFVTSRSSVSDYYANRCQAVGMDKTCQAAK